MSRKIRVLEMIDEAEVGGGQVHVVLLAKYLDHSEFDVTIACGGAGFLIEEARRLGVKVISAPMSNRLRASTFRRVFGVLKESRCDILHTHGGTPGFWGRTASLVGRMQTKRIHTYHGFHYLHRNGFGADVFRNVDRWLLKSTHKVICVCRSDYDTGMAMGLVTQEKGVIIHNGIEVERFAEMGARERMREEFGVRPDQFLFCHVGRLHSQKGQSYLIDGFARLHHKRPEVRLIIVGEGELRGMLGQRCQDAGVSHAVLFVGTRQDIPSILEASDAFVLPSLWEGQPISLLEAMAAGKPIIATSVDGIVEVAHSGRNALLVRPRDVDELEKAMKRVYEDATLRKELARTARLAISGEFTADQMAQRVGGLYKDMILHGAE